jgi:hypothetical protein
LTCVAGIAHREDASKSLLTADRKKAAVAGMRIARSTSISGEDHDHGQ